MPPVSTAAFGRALRSLGPDERAAFVADLWTARGFETTVEGTTVVATHPGRSGRTRIACGPTNRGLEDVDAVIALEEASGADSADARVIGAGDLREMLLYALDRDEARALTERHLGRPLVSPASASANLIGSPRPTRRQLVALGLLVVVVAGLAVGTSTGPVAHPDSSVEATDAPVPPTTRTETGTPRPFQATRIPLAFAGPRTARAGGDLFRYPPGLGTSGVTEVEALASAHRSVLADERWSLRMVHDGTLDLLHPFRRWDTVEQTLVRTGPTRYRFDVVGVAQHANASFTSVTYVDYGDGTANFRREYGPPSNRFRRTRLPTDGPPGVFASVSASYVRRYLATTESRTDPIQIEGQPHTLVAASGTPKAFARTVTNYTAIAVVDRRGVVERLVVEYTLLRRVPDPDPNGIATPYAPDDEVPTEPIGQVRFEMVLSDRGTATLTAPSWYEQARAATNGSTLPPWPNEPAV